MAVELNNGQMDPDLKEISLTELNLALARLHGRTVMNMREDLKTIISRAKVPTNGQTVAFTVASGLMAKCTGKEH